ncbi:hypothetical protein F4604DRAFT_1712737 [Suillus subluteus]|nr:hypothetical protein F4604DRAFT_1712737 [Suillus subluteus]
MSSVFCPGLQMAWQLKSGKKDAVRDAAVRTNVHLGEPEEPNRFGLTLDPSKLRVGIQDEEFIKLKVGHEVLTYTAPCFCDLPTTVLLPLTRCTPSRRCCVSHSSNSTSQALRAVAKIACDAFLIRMGLLRA